MSKRKRSAKRQAGKKGSQSEPTIDGLSVYEFILRNADPIWLLQEEMYPELAAWEEEQNRLLQRDYLDTDDDDPRNVPF
jgi:hypothetical protein